MKLTLSDNIRLFRKQRKMIQEKLAEALGVTVRAVYKWESGLSLPEIGMIVEIADFFDTSVDALLGYRMKDNRMDSTLERLYEYCQTLDPAALTEAEKALGKYPHAFRIVYACGKVYLAFGAGNHDENHLRRSLELMEQSLMLLSQNSDPRVNEAVVHSKMATAWFLLNEKEKALELLKRSNAGGIYNSQIGAYLAAFMNRTEEAGPYLAEALLDSLNSLFSIIFGYVFVYRSRDDWESATAITAWGIELLNGLKTEEKPDFLDKIHAELLATLAFVQAKAGRREKADDSLRKAAFLARRFDSKPEYSLKTMRFGENNDKTAVFDTFGATASGSVESLIGLLDDGAMKEQWKEICGHEG